MVLQPGNSFTVVRQIGNHTDSGTYYVRAVIRNAYSDDIIATLNLTDKGSQRFKYDWLVPQDPSGQGFYISIVTSVYTDSGYTTKSENYSDEENTYLIQERVLQRGGGGGGGIDAFNLRRIIGEELDKRQKDDPETEDEPTEPEEPMRWDEVLTVLKELRRLVEAIEPAKPTDLSPVFDGIRYLAQCIDEKPVTDATDITPILEAVRELGERVGNRQDAFAAALQSFDEDTVEKLTTALANVVKQSTFNLSPWPAQMSPPGNRDSGSSEFDVKKLAM